MKRYFFAAALLFMGSLLFVQGREKVPVYKDSTKSVEERVEDLLGRMNNHEKVMQLVQYVLGRNDNANNVADPLDNIPAETGSVIYMLTSPEQRNSMQKKAVEESRLGIPMMFAFDAIHGFRTIYPISLAQACSWDPDLVREAAGVSAREAWLAGIDWTFSPMIDVAHDGRWGRVSEGYGEDPYTNGVFGISALRGYQENKVASCLKHYVGYGASEAGRDYVYSEISRQTLWDTYMPPYRMCVPEAASVMSSFNCISGVPGSANKYTLTTVLRDKFKFRGPVVSDWGAIQQLRAQGYASSLKEAAELAFNAGVDIDMMNGCYDKYLEELVNEGKVSQNDLDDAVRRVLKMKFEYGLFEHPYTPVTTEQERFLRPESLEVVERLAEETMVLLKNEGSILPLDNNKRIALVGPMVKDQYNLLGAWAGHGEAKDVTTIYDAMCKEYGADAILYAKGCDFDGDDESMIEEAVAAAKSADVVVLCLGEKQRWSGENASRSTIALPAIQEKLAQAVKAAGKPMVLVLNNGRPLELCRLEPISDAILEAWQPGVSGGTPIAKVLSGEVNPSGKLSITFPYSTGQIPIYYNRRQSARLNQGFYQDIPSDPLYEFGHGLSYTTFEYSDIKASSDVITADSKVTLEVTVTNTGDRDGVETVHWFLRQPVNTSIARPVKELKHFERQMIRRGESCTYKFEIGKDDLAFVNSEGDYFLADHPEYCIMVKDKTIKLTLK
jgi:beta-glucosidase